MKAVIVETTVVRYELNLPEAATPDECYEAAQSRFATALDSTEFPNEVLSNQFAVESISLE